MTALNVGAMPVAPSVPAPTASTPKTPAALRQDPESTFNAMFSDASPDPEPTKEEDHNDEPAAAVPVFVPAPPKLLLPITFTSAGDQDTPASVTGQPAQQNANFAPDAIELSQPLAARKFAAGEMAFAAKLVEMAPQIQSSEQPAASQPAPPPAFNAAQKPIPSTAPAPAIRTGQATPAPAAEPHTTAPAASQRTTAGSHAEPDNQRQTSSDSPARHSSEPSAALHTEAATQVSMPRDVASSPVTPRGIENTPPTIAADPILPKTEHASQTPLNEITLRVANADQSSASIRMVDHGGELRIAVRASDPQLADSLRGSVDQLTSRLNSNGWGAEVWKPGAVAAAQRTQSSSQEMFQGQQGSRYAQEERSHSGQQNQKQKYPDWVEEFYANHE